MHERTEHIITCADVHMHPHRLVLQTISEDSENGLAFYIKAHYSFMNNMVGGPPLSHDRNKAHQAKGKEMRVFSIMTLIRQSTAVFRRRKRDYKWT